jgi:hypothetical protein
VRKEVETQIVEVPVRREKLIVEQVTPNYQQLAVVELGAAQVSESELPMVRQTMGAASVSGEFPTTTAAIQFLAAIAAESNSGVRALQINVVLENAAQQERYQRLLEQYSSGVARS